MTPHRIKWTLLIVPVLLIGGYETLRDQLCIPYLSVKAGNALIALITAGVIALISRGLFHRFEQTETELIHERETRARLEERERLARELHDRIAQSIFYLGIRIQSAQTQDTPQPPRVLAALNEVLGTLREMETGVRQTISELRQPSEP